MAESELLNSIPGEDQGQPRKRRGLDAGSIVLIFGILSVVAVVGIQLLNRNEGPPTGGSNAPDFTVTTFDGESFTLSEQRGNIVVINFWASWCGPCRDEAPDLEQVYQEYKDQGVIFIGITYVDEVSDSLAFIDEFGQTYPNAPDSRSRVSAKYGVRAVPETFIVGRDGNIVDGGALLLPINASILRNVLNRALAGEKAA